MKKILITLGLVLASLGLQAQVVQPGQTPVQFRTAINNKFDDHDDSIVATRVARGVLLDSVAAHRTEVDAIKNDSLTAHWTIIEALKYDSIAQLRIEIDAASDITYPAAGIPLSTGSAWSASITNNSVNWNTAFSWDDHADAGYQSLLTNEAGLYAALSDVTDFLQPGDAVTSLDGTAWRFYYSNGTGDLTELALGTDGQVLTSTGAATAPAFEAISVHDPVTLAGTPDYITITDQVITRGLIVLTTDVSGELDTANINMAQLDDKFVVAADSIPLVWGNLLTGTETATELTIDVDPIPASALSATGTADATTFLRGDNTWATPAGGGGLTQPTFTSAEIGTYTDSTIAVLWSKNLYAGANAATTDFTVTEDGGAYALSSISYSDDTILLVGSAAGTYGSTYLIDYDPGTNPVKDSTNLWALAFTGNAVTNNVAEGDLTAPLYVSSEIGTYNDSIILVLLDESLNETAPATTAFTVTEDTNNYGVYVVTINDDSLKIAMDSVGLAGATYLLSYTPPVTNPLQDAAGNQVVAWVDSTVTNNLGLTAENDSATWEQEWKDVYYTMAEADRPALDTAHWYNSFVDSLKIYNYWSRIDLLYVLAQKTEAGAFINWSNPSAGTYDLVKDADMSVTYSFTPYRSIYSTTTGDIITTNWNPSTATAGNYTLNSGAFGVYSLTDETTTSYLAYADDDTNASWILPGSTYYGRINSSSSVSAANSSSLGFFMVSRTAVDLTTIYKDGVSLNTGTMASTALPNAQFLVLGGQASNREKSLVIVLNGATDTEASNINLIVDQLMTRLGISTQ